MADSSAGNCGNAVAEAEDLVTHLYQFRDHYVANHGIEKAAQKQEDVTKEMAKVLEKLETIRELCENEDRAKYYYLLGKTLNITPKYDDKALDYLTKAVKLNPTMIEAWNDLGECYWKKGNMDDAKNSFLGALKHKQNKISLRQLSMVLRQIKDNNDKLKNIEESVLKAREAVHLDVTDGTSWCVLGNAYLTLFFATDQNPKLLKQATTAYSHAVILLHASSEFTLTGVKVWKNRQLQTPGQLKDPVANSNPDLHYNRAIVLKYEEEYQEALEGFSQALALDPSWSEARTKEEDLLSYLSAVQELVQKKGRLKTKRLKNLLQSINPSQLGPYGGGSYTSPHGSTIKLELISLLDLSPGLNLHKVVLGKVVCNVAAADDPIPFTFCMIDQKETCWSVTVYNLAPGKGVIIGDAVAIPEPFVQEIKVKHQNKDFLYSSIRVDTPLVLVVNGKKLGVDKQAMTEIAVSILAS